MQLFRNQLVIHALVRRHVEDAAFYWSQHDMSKSSHNADLSTLKRFNDLLSAHLEGIVVAGDAAWQPALDALQRWRKPGEMFVCSYVAICGSSSISLLNELSSYVASSPYDLVRGVSSAMAWAPDDLSRKAICQLTAKASPPAMTVAALRAVALIGNRTGPAYIEAEPSSWLALPLNNYLTSETAHVRAAACRAAATLDFDSDIVSQLQCRLTDADVAVRAQAAIAFFRVLRTASELRASNENALGLDTAETLWQCIVAQVPATANGSGWHAMQTTRRLNSWVEHLAIMVPLGHGRVPALLSFMPPRLALRFVLNHGDPAHLPYVETLMHDACVSRYAGWVWQTITGIDLSMSGLTNPDEDSRVTKDISASQDTGTYFPQPDSVAIASLARPALTHGIRYFAGEPVSASTALHALEMRPQPERTVAARLLHANDPVMHVGVRSPASEQLAVIAQFRELIKHESAA